MSTSEPEAAFLSDPSDEQEDDDSPSSQAAIRLKPLKRYCVWVYYNDWDGWGYVNQGCEFGDRQEAEECAKRLAETWNGVAVTEVLAQHIEPAPDTLKWMRAKQEARVQH
jgi:hypothetical protein